MTFISYAQNFEDVILWRALKHIENGTYVDVGAQDPVVDSVSRAFYEHGWRGVHVEPVPLYAERLRRDRPDEIVLQAALGAEVGTIALNVIPDTGLSTAVDSTAQRHHDAGFETQRTHVPLLTLKSALGMLAGCEVHWLKIDVEGFEEEVLKGWDSSVLRPWVMVIEATVPGSAEADYASWDPIVLAAGYQFVYFDGLNRFYVANEHTDLVPAFRMPPNVFDDVQVSGKGSWGLCRQVEAAHQALLAQAEERAEAALLAERAEGARFAQMEYAARAEADALRLRCDAQAAEIADLMATRRSHHALRERCDAVAVRAAELDGEVARLRREDEEGKRRLSEAHIQTHEWWSVADRLSGEVKALHASTSWRVTAPLRLLSHFTSRLLGLPSRGAHLVNRGVRASARPVVVWGLRTVLARPRARAGAARMLERHPKLKHSLRQFALRAGLIHVAARAEATALPPIVARTLDIAPQPDLARRAVRIYEQLKKNKQSENS